MLKQKSTWSKILFRLLAYTYTYVLCTHVRIHIRPDLAHLDSSGPPGPGGSSRSLGSQLSTPSAQGVCACAYMHTYIYIHCVTPTGLKNRDDTDRTPISPSVPNNPQRQATSAFTDYLNPITLVPQRQMNKLNVHEPICTSCGRRCGVAQASFNLPRWYRRLWFALLLGRGPHPPQKSISTMFLADFYSCHTAACRSICGTQHRPRALLATTRLLPPTANACYICC